MECGDLSPLWISLAPVILPVLLMSANTVAAGMGASASVQNITAIVGNRDLALLLAAAIAMYVLVRNRGLSLGELSKKAETALMSGGVIILIRNDVALVGMGKPPALHVTPVRANARTPKRGRKATRGRD